ncbi:MAG: RNA polymerase factor sigma-54, partial [Pseudomonadota bacterium]
MALGPRLDLRQSQSLVMTPQLQQAIKLLALSNLEIETFIGEALESNPLLDAGELTQDVADAAIELPAEATTADQLMLAGAGEADAPLDIAPETLDRDRDTGDWSAPQGAGGGGEEGPGIDEHGGDTPDLATHLEAQIGPQIGMGAHDARTAFIARHIVGLLDDAGYLPVHLREVSQDLGVSTAEAEAALDFVQTLDPTGVGARTLGECLALQAKEADRYDPCMQVLIANLDLLAKGSFAQLKRICDVDDEDFADMLNELRDYDPKPGLKFAVSERVAVVPDLLITAGRDSDGSGGGWDIQINQATLPRLVVNREYYVELRGGCADKASKAWLSEKLADANWLIKALDQRQKTILKVAAEIVKQQDGFFRKGVSELRPLTLNRVAEAIEMHESTVSRVTSNKYLHCDRGTFELKYFFTSGVGGGTDGEGASAETVKARIKALIDAEKVT